MNKASRPTTSASKRPDRNIRRQRATAENLAKGMTTEKAMLQAGYSPSYAHDQGYKAIKRPCIVSAFTDSCERIMQKRQIQFDEIVEPYFDALNAPLMVKSTQLGDAYMPLDPKTQLPYPDHAIRMEAAGHLIDLHGGRPREMELPSEPQKGLTIIFQKEAGAKVAVVVTQPDRTRIVPTGETKHPTIPVVFRKPNGST